MFVEACARLWTRLMAIEAQLLTAPTDDQLNRLSLAILRQWIVLAGKLGLNPMDRNRLLSCHASSGRADENDLLD